MSPKFQKDAILEGLVDSYCLVCDDHLRGEDELVAHIAKPVHGKNLKATEFVKDFANDKIIKVRHGYFCILCGLFLSTFAKTSLHIKEKQHYHNKAVQDIERVGGYVSVDGLLIDYKAWSGLMEDSCAVCNVEVSCQNLHKSQPSHIMNLIHSVVVFGEKGVYRKVDESCFHCITCNKLYSLHALPSHFEDSEHKKRWAKCKIEYVHHNVKQNKIKFVSCGCFKPINPVALNRGLQQHEKISSHSSSSEGFDSDYPSDSNDFSDAVDNFKEDDFVVQQTILDSVNSFEKNEVNINFENETAFCKKCFVNISFDYNTILSHIKEHDKTAKRRNCSYVPFPCEVNMKCKIQPSCEQAHSLLSIETSANAGFEADINPINENNIGTAEEQNPAQTNNKKYSFEDRAAFAHENQLEYERNNKNVYCRICKVMLPNSIASMKEHVSGSIHKKLETKHFPTSDKTFYRKSSMADFIDELMTVRNYAGTEKVVNGKYCINEWSFLMITGTGLGLRCQACEVNLDSDEVKLHEESWGHHRAMSSTPVVTSVDKTEFVREVRPGIFHCGYCNMVIAPWADLQNHFKSNEHKTVKNHYQARLRRLMPQLLSHRIRRQVAMEMRASQSNFGFRF